MIYVRWPDCRQHVGYPQCGETSGCLMLIIIIIIIYYKIKLTTPVTTVGIGRIRQARPYLVRDEDFVCTPRSVLFFSHAKSVSLSPEPSYWVRPNKYVKRAVAGRPTPRRTAYLREIGPFDHKRKGRLFKRDHEMVQWNVDIWCAQQSLRRRWKSRDWSVVEMPFQVAPPALQRVLPETHTDIPQMIPQNYFSHCHEHCSPSPSSATSSGYQPPEDRYHKTFTHNVRQQVFDVEEVQNSLFGGCNVYPIPQRIDRTAMTLEKFL
eukprot:gene9559-6715_t